MLTPKQEAFVLAYIETGNASEAYRQAGYKAGNAKTINEAASRLLKNSKVIARVNELREKHVERHEVTVDTLVAELEEARAVALKSEAPAAMVSATMGKAKLYGLIIDRNEHAGRGGGPIQVIRVENIYIDPKSAPLHPDSVPPASAAKALPGS